MQNPDEYSNLQALAKGEEKGLNWLFEQYRKPIFHFCLKLLKDQALAEEATADVFITIWKKRHIVDTDQSLQPFLYKITRDTAYNYLRKVASSERLKQRFWDHYPFNDHKDGEWHFLQKEHATQVEHIVSALPRQRQVIFRMRYYDGKDNPTIAQELKLSVHTVKSQLVKARVYVRQQIETKGLSNAFVLLGLWLMIN